MLIYRGIMVIVVVVGVVLVRSFNGDIVIVFQYLFLQNYLKFFFMRYMNLRNFLLESLLFIDICFVVYYIIFVLIINVRKNFYFYQIIRGFDFMYCIFYVELNILNIDVFFCILEIWWYRYFFRRYIYIIFFICLFIRKVIRGIFNIYIIIFLLLK